MVASSGDAITLFRFAPITVPEGAIGRDMTQHNLDFVPIGDALDRSPITIDR